MILPIDIQLNVTLSIISKVNTGKMSEVIKSEVIMSQVNVRGDVRGKMSELIISELKMPTLYQVILYSTITI